MTRLSYSLEETATLLDVASDVDEKAGLLLAARASSQWACELRYMAFDARWSRMLRDDDELDPIQAES